MGVAVWPIRGLPRWSTNDMLTWHAKGKLIRAVAGRDWSDGYLAGRNTFRRGWVRVHTG